MYMKCLGHWCPVSTKEYHAVTHIAVTHVYLICATLMTTVLTLTLTHTYYNHKPSPW